MWVVFWSWNIKRMEEMDILYDEIGSGLKIRQIQQEKRQLLEELELFYKVFFLKQKIE